MKKLIIMVQACTSGQYPELMKTQKETWDSIKVEGIKTAYYMGSPTNKVDVVCIPNNQEIDSWALFCKTSDDYNNMHWKFKMAMDYVWDWDWDFMFRTNASTFVRKERILQFIQNCPTERYYSGVVAGDYASGTNVLMSRDCVDIARKNMIDSPNPSEDTYLGTVLKNNGIQVQEGVSRLSFNFDEPWKILDADCYRCKSPNEDRNNDIIAFKKLMEHHYGK